MVLKLINNLTKSVQIFDNLVDNEESRLFWSFNIVLAENTDEGEYTYQLFDSDEMIATGLVQIGDYKPVTVSYNGKNNEYKVYDN